MEEDPLAGDPRYETINMVGGGANGFVAQVRDNERNEEVAVKFLPRGPHITEHVRRELMNYKNLLHPHVIQFKDVFLTDHYVAIVMEYAPGGDLLRFIRNKKGMSEDMARWFFQQLIVGLDYIHKKGVANRDIKLDNILLTSDPWPIVKICDFGLSKSINIDSDPHSFVGTRPYMAPEVVRNSETQDHTYNGMKADIWSCGVSLYVMLVLDYPFQHRGEDGVRNLPVIYQRIMNGEYNIPRGSMSAECADLIQRILVVDPQERIDIPGIQQHPWYQKNLPEGAVMMNDELESQMTRSDSEIVQIFEDARNV